MRGDLARILLLLGAGAYSPAPPEAFMRQAEEAVGAVAVALWLGRVWRWGHP